MGELISIVILNYNGAHLLPECLSSLTKQDYPNLELLVVDNASIDQSCEIAAQFSNVKWIPLSVNAGLGPGYNAGAKASSGERIFFVNNDMRFERNCVSELSRVFDGGDIFSADPLQKNWDGTQVIHGAQKFHRAWSCFGIPFIQPFQNLNASGPEEVAWACAGAMMVDRKKFEVLGGFDPTFFLDYEDVDICWRAWMRGWKTVFTPSAQLYHKVGETEDSKLSRNNPQFENQKAPKINARRKVSAFKNAGRFILKTMPWSLILVSFGSGFLLFCASLVKGRFEAACLLLKAFLLNLISLPAILNERYKILKSSKKSSAILLRELMTAP